MLFVSCEDSTKTVYKVTFNSNGESAVPAVEVEEGEKATKPTDPTKDGYNKFDKWTTDKAGKEDYDFESPVKEDITLYAKWRDYDIGDTGPAGGWIFYDVDDDNDDGNADKLSSSSCGWRYLEAAPSNLNTTMKFSETKITDVTTDTAIGKGYENTVALANKGATAAKACIDITTNAPWFLPSSGELAAMHNNLYTENLGGNNAKNSFNDSSSSYWSSSIDKDKTTTMNNSYVYAYRQVFYNATSDNMISEYNTQTFNVRPVRRF